MSILSQNKNLKNEYKVFTGHQYFGIFGSTWGYIMCSRPNAFGVLPVSQYDIRQGFPNWGTCTPRGTFRLLKGYIIM